MRREFQPQMALHLKDHDEFLEVEYNQSEDYLVCQTPRGTVEVQDDDNWPMERLLTALKQKLGDLPDGCHNCRYFQVGTMVSGSDTLGFCYQGQLGRPLDTEDFPVQAYGSCQHHQRGDARSQEVELTRWEQSVKRCR